MVILTATRCLALKAGYMLFQKGGTNLADYAPSNSGFSFLTKWTEAYRHSL